MLNGTAEGGVPGGVVFLLDVDNTLLDNDAFAAGLGARLEQDFGAAERDRYWDLFAKLRNQLGYADYLGTLQTFRDGLENHPQILHMSAFLLDYPFERLVFPQALEVIARLRTLGRPVVLSDGDVVFQPRKVRRSGIWDAVEGRVLIQVHKQNSLADTQRRYPAEHYVMVDDKPQLLAAVKQVLGARVTTVFVQQGHYAVAADVGAVEPPPDLRFQHIGELLDCDPGQFSRLLAAAAPGRAHEPTSQPLQDQT